MRSSRCASSPAPSPGEEIPQTLGPPYFPLFALATAFALPATPMFSRPALALSRRVSDLLITRRGEGRPEGEA